jgi:hypothetical protein
VNQSLLGFSLGFAIALDKAVYATFCVNDLLLSGVIRVAAAANFNADLLFGRSGFYFVAADACCGHRGILRMNTFLHLKPSFVRCKNNALLASQSTIVPEVAVAVSLSVYRLMNFDTFALRNVQPFALNIQIHRCVRRHGNGPPKLSKACFERRSAAT